jgi:hypothetical protein
MSHSLPLDCFLSSTKTMPSASTKWTKAAMDFACRVLAMAETASLNMQKKDLFITLPGIIDYDKKGWHFQVVLDLTH